MATEPAQRGVIMYDDLKGTPTPGKVAFYEPEIKGQKKKVLVAIDKIESGAGVTITFWIKCKVEL